MGDRFAPVPQPASTLEDLRAALAQLAPAALPMFDAERAEAVREARETVNSAPLRRFVGQWTVCVAIERHPTRAARLRELEALVAESGDPLAVREMVAEIGRIHDAAFVEAGLKPEGHTTA
ncbi:DUF6247 family protein [Streptomyces orinoci]|uniref:DUF6247 family protein n=1 Tax=Streptomyces orinoci TaxID=67339 RepID=A0ABV3K143_STRON|nr:DUF6247 family protein [Streptomyces orinoci]